jgi:hypothetical protein
VVRAHPTVPAFAPLLCRSNLNSAFQPTATLVLWRVVHRCLRIPIRSPTIPPNFAWGMDDDFSIRKFSVWIAAGRSPYGFDRAGLRPDLHTRTGAGLYRRRVPALQLRDPRRRPRDRLHGRQKVPALAGLPSAVRAGSRAERGRSQAGWQADHHPACNAAQSRGRQAAHGQKTGEARELTARGDLKELRHFKISSRGGLPCLRRL